MVRFPLPRFGTKQAGRRAVRIELRGVPVQQLETKWPMLGSTPGPLLLGGGALTQHKVLPGLKQFGRLAKDAANNDFEGV
jgi:hypothetical protein